MQMFSFDHLTDTEFEEFCFDLLTELGFTNLSWRKGTGLSTSPSDRGRDIQGEYVRSDLDGTTTLETWFFECKHYKQGVPPTKIEGALTWATSERPSKLVIIASNFLSNPTKDFIDNYCRNNRPSYQIKQWERPDLERLTAGKTQLLRKYRVSGDFPFVEIMHPAHLRYLKDTPLTSLSYLFDCLELLEESDRDAILGMTYYMIIRPRFRTPITGDETMGELQVDDANYGIFKQKCFNIVESNALDHHVLGYLIASYALQSCFRSGDTTAIEEYAMRHHRFIDHLQNRAAAETAPEEIRELSEMLTFTQKVKDELPQRTKRSYGLYVRFCEVVIERLLAEVYMS